MIRRARQLLLPGETGLALFTYGRGFHVSKNVKTATINGWILNIDKDVDRVIIYRRQYPWNLVYIGDPWAFTQSLLPGRFDVHLVNVKIVGFVEVSWDVFAGAGRNPVRRIVGQLPRNEDRK